jgi:glutamine cyclotransferase
VGGWAQKIRAGGWIVVALYAAALAPARAALPVCTYHVVHIYPHDRTAFTEGLFYRDGLLYESSGMAGASRVVARTLEDARPLREARFDPQHFGEGIIDWNGQIIGLTWHDGVGYRWDLQTLAPRGRFVTQGEGWGMTHDDRTIYQSDGSSTLILRDPESFAERATLAVDAEGVPVTRLNELEWIDGEIWANIWFTERVARIDPATGHVKAWVDLSGLRSQADVTEPDDVLNGIAYDAGRHRIFVTGKNWSKLYQITMICPRGWRAPRQ